MKKYCFILFFLFSIYSCKRDIGSLDIQTLSSSFNADLNEISYTFKCIRNDKRDLDLEFIIQNNTQNTIPISVYDFQNGSNYIKVFDDKMNELEQFRFQVKDFFIFSDYFGSLENVIFLKPNKKLKIVKRMKKRIYFLPIASNGYFRFQRAFFINSVNFIPYKKNQILYMKAYYFLNPSDEGILKLEGYNENLKRLESNVIEVKM